MALTAGNIETILNTLVYDGKAESVGVVSGMGDEGGREGARAMYRLSRSLVNDTGLSRVPCGVCPVSGMEPGPVFQWEVLEPCLSCWLIGCAVELWLKSICVHLSPGSTCGLVAYTLVYFLYGTYSYLFTGRDSGLMTYI